MPIIGKIVLCSSARSKICDEQGIGSYALWTRYASLEPIIAKHIPEQYRSFFAQPQSVKDSGEEEIFWHTEPSRTGDVPTRLTKLSGDKRLHYEGIKNKTIAVYQQAIDACLKSAPTDAEYFQKALKHVGEFDDCFYCFDDKVVVVLWSMRPRDINDITNTVIEKIIQPNVSYTVIFNIGEHGHSDDRLEIHKRPTDTPIQSHQIPNVTPLEGYIFKGWNVVPLNYKINADTVFTAQYEKISEPEPPLIQHNVRFEDQNGNLISECFVNSGSILAANLIPHIANRDREVFKGWDNDTTQPIYEDRVFRPLFESPPLQRQHNVRFEDQDGNLISECSINDGSILAANLIPHIANRDKDVFKGWDNDTTQPIHEDKVFRPLFEPKPLSWWERFLIWWRENGCLKKLLRLLLFLLLLLLLIWLLRQCDGGGCSCNDNPTSNYTGQNPFLPTPPPGGIGGGDGGMGETPDSNTPGDNGLYQPIQPGDPGFEFLPEHPNKPIPIDDGDIIDDEEGNRRILANRLNVLLDDDVLTINQFAVDFKAVYAGDQYQIIYADPIIKRLQLQIPEDERVQIKNELVQRLPEQYTPNNVFVWDEALMTRTFVPNDSRIGECWYHNAIKTYAAWDVTMGNEDIVVAIVDDGINLRHNEFRDKIIKPYNVFTQSEDVRESEVGHGTHVAGLAIASANNQSGIAGVAPNCKLMPIQVFDRDGYCSTMSVLDGVLYAVYNGADVVNLSLGMMINAQLPSAAQQELINSYFKEEERVWKKVFSIANRNNTAIIIAAGNENLMAGIEPMHRSEDVIVVAAVGENHNPLHDKASFSNYGSYTDVSAPGTTILSTIGNNKCDTMSGTSMAAPIVAGAVALIKSVNRPLSTAQIRTILQETGVEVNGDIGKLIQLDKALAKAQNADVNLIDTHPEPTTGSVQVLLEWHNYNDLDLICVDPNGEAVWYRNKKVSSGGMLEIDMNAGSQYSSSPIENIYWPQSGAPKGTYNVGVLYYKRHDTQYATSDFKVTVRYGDAERLYEGTAQNQDETLKICEFTLE